MDTTNAAHGFIEMLKSQIAEIDVQLDPLLEKRKAKANLANATAADAGLPIPFPDTGSTVSLTPAAHASDVVAPDHYTPMKMATAVREILQRRKAKGLSAIDLDELYNQLKTGGYPFRATGKENAVLSLATTLGKNIIFRRVPNNPKLWGLSEWYGGPARRKSTETGGDDGDEEAETPETSPAATPQSGQ